MSKKICTKLCYRSQNIRETYMLYLGDNMSDTIFVKNCYEKSKLAIILIFVRNITTVSGVLLFFLSILMYCRNKELLFIIMEILSICICIIVFFSYYIGNKVGKKIYKAREKEKAEKLLKEVELLKKRNCFSSDK